MPTIQCASWHMESESQLTTLECDRSCSIPGVTRPQKSMTVVCAEMKLSESRVCCAAIDSQYIVHSCHKTRVYTYSVHYRQRAHAGIL